MGHKTKVYDFQTPMRKLRERGLLPLCELHAQAHFVSVMDMLSEKRFKPVAAARHAVWHALRQKPYEYSFPMIADLFGVDHTTVMSAVEKLVGRAPERTVTATLSRLSARDTELRQRAASLVREALSDLGPFEQVAECICQIQELALARGWSPAQLAQVLGMSLEGYDLQRPPAASVATLKATDYDESGDELPVLELG